MESNKNLNLNVRLMPNLETAIDRWLAARRDYKKQANDRNQHSYNAAYFVLGEEWVERYPEAADVPGAFEWFRRGLIAPEIDE